MLLGLCRQLSQPGPQSEAALQGHPRTAAPAACADVGLLCRGRRMPLEDTSLAIPSACAYMSQYAEEEVALRNIVLHGVQLPRRHSTHTDILGMGVLA